MKTQAQQISTVATKISDGNPTCADDALDALAEFDVEAKFIDARDYLRRIYG